MVTDPRPLLPRKGRLSQHTDLTLPRMWDHKDVWPVSGLFGTRPRLASLCLHLFPARDDPSGSLFFVICQSVILKQVRNAPNGIDLFRRSRGKAPTKERVLGVLACGPGCSLGSLEPTQVHESQIGLDVLLKLTGSYCLFNGNTAVEEEREGFSAFPRV